MCIVNLIIWNEKLDHFSTNVKENRDSRNVDD